MLKQCFLASIVVLLPLSASAEPIVENMGVRVGGYGFREATHASGEGKSGTGWQACRMNGLGVFANKGMGKNFFVEGGLDTYFTETFPTGEAMGTYDILFIPQILVGTKPAASRVTRTGSVFNRALQQGVVQLLFLSGNGQSARS